MSDPNALPIAGWYPDPEDDKGDRWWNGATWSDHRRPRNAGPGWAPAPAEPVKKAATTKAAAAAPAVAEAPIIAASPAPPPAPGVVNPYAGGTQPAAPYAQPAYAPYAPAYAPNYAPATPMRNPLAMGGMITSLVGLLFNWILWGAPGIVGAIVSFIGLRKANRLAREGVTVGNGKAMAITGIVSGLVGAFLFNLFYFTYWSPLMFS